MQGIDSTYAWRRLAASVALSTVGGIGMWSLTVAIPAVQADLGITRADISFAYTMNTLGFFAGGVIVGRIVDRRGIVVAAILSAIGLALGFHETSAFTATFQRLVGTTPSAWRRTRPWEPGAWEPGDGPSVQLAVMPPSITSSLPVTHADSSDAR